MTVDQADEIMAEYLLKGGKMLAKSCKICGHPLFEYKGETQCVICPQETSGERPPEPEPSRPVRETAPEPVTGVSRGEAAAEIERTIIHLCERIRGEPGPGECLALMKAVERGAEALARLDQR